MKRGAKVLFALAAVLAIASGPTWANCPFSSQICSGGLCGSGVPGILLGGGPIGGTWYEAGFGDPLLGAGNDAGGTELIPAVADAVWVSRTIDPRGPTLDWDWFNAGSDGCISGGAGAGVVGVYLLDGGSDYAVALVNGFQSAFQNGHDFDDVLTGLGPFGNDIPFEPQALVPAVNLDILTLTPTTVVGDVLPLAASVNCYDDGNGQCGDPNNIVCGPAQLEQLGVGPVPGCTEAGCVGVTFQRGSEYCWDAGASCQVAGSVSIPAGFCAGFPAAACTDDTQCPPVFGPCVFPPPTVLAMGPPVAPGGCVLIADGVTVAGQAYDVVVGKSKGHKVFSWKVNELAVSHMQVVGTTRGERNLGPQVFPRANDGSTQSYEVLIPNGDVRFEKSFVVRVVGQDGTVSDTPAE